jgi:hypothetical protein
MKANDLPAAASPAIRINRTNSGGGKNRQSRSRQNLKRQRKKNTEADPEPIKPSEFRKGEKNERVGEDTTRYGADNRHSPDKSKRSRSIDVRV